MAKFRFAKSIAKMPKGVAADIDRLNALRNGLAHAFFPENHDLRRTCARLCHDAGGELEQIQFLLGHVNVQTTERSLGCKQRLRNAVNDSIGIEPDLAAQG